jgi:hypothetical protein
MKISMKLIATVLAAALVSGSMATPASAFFFGPPKFFFHFPKFPFKPFKPHYPKAVKKTPTSANSSNSFPWVVACVMGSAVGLISASVAKATAAGQPPRWLSQVEYERTRNNTANHLTSTEAATIGFSCGLGAFPVIANYNR